MQTFNSYILYKLKININKKKSKKKENEKIIHSIISPCNNLHRSYPIPK